MYSAVIRFLGNLNAIRLPIVKFVCGDANFDWVLLDEHALRVAPARQTGIALCLIIWVAFSIRDFSSISGASEEVTINLYNFEWAVAALRLIGTISMTLGLFASYRPQFKTCLFSEGVLLILISICCVCTLGLASIMNIFFDYIRDLPSLIVFIFTTISLFRMRTRAVLPLVVFFL